MNLPVIQHPPARPRSGLRDRRRVKRVVPHQDAVEEQAVLTLDLYGHILSSTLAAARMLGMRPENLAGHTASALITPLPLGRYTPGYNLAYATFHALCYPWQRMMAHSADHGQFAAEVSIAVVNWHGARAIRLTLCTPQSGQQTHSQGESHKSGGG